MHGRSRMTIWYNGIGPRIPTMPGRVMLGFHRPGRGGTAGGRIEEIRGEVWGAGLNEGEGGGARGYVRLAHPLFLIPGPQHGAIRTRDAAGDRYPISVIATR